MAAEQGDLVGDLARLREGDDGESAAAARIPIDGEVFGVDLWGRFSFCPRRTMGRCEA